MIIITIDAPGIRHSAEIPLVSSGFFYTTPDNAVFLTGLSHKTKISMATSSNPDTSGKYDPKVIALLSYLTIIGWIVAVVLNSPKSTLASFHIRQSLGLTLLFTAANVVMIVPILGWIVGVLAIIGGFILWVIGFISALNGEMRRVPYLGDYFQEWFDGF